MTFHLHLILPANLPDAVLGINGTEIITGVYWITPFVDGVATISIQETSAETWYLVFMMPDGTVTVSEAIDICIN
jgi:hypothetical protein